MARGYGIKNYPELFDYLQQCGEMSFQSPFYCLKTRGGRFYDYKFRSLQILKLVASQTGCL